MVLPHHLLNHYHLVTLPCSVQTGREIRVLHRAAPFTVPCTREAVVWESKGQVLGCVATLQEIHYYLPCRLNMHYPGTGKKHLPTSCRLLDLHSQVPGTRPC